MTSQDQWKVLGRGPTGCVWLDGSSGSYSASLSGIPSSRFDESIERLEIGGLLMDAEGVDDHEGSAHVIGGPMLKLSLPAGTVEQGIISPVRSKYRPWMELKALDYVSLDVWAGLWRALGARVGTKTETGVVWQEEG